MYYFYINFEPIPLIFENGLTMSYSLCSNAIFWQNLLSLIAYNFSREGAMMTIFCLLIGSSMYYLYINFEPIPLTFENGLTMSYSLCSNVIFCQNLLYLNAYNFSREGAMMTKFCLLIGSSMYYLYINFEPIPLTFENGLTMSYI